MPKSFSEIVQKGGFKLEPWDWNFYAEQVRKAKYDLDDNEVKPYFELNKVLQNGWFKNYYTIITYC